MTGSSAEPDLWTGKVICVIQYSMLTLTVTGSSGGRDWNSGEALIIISMKNIHLHFQATLVTDLLQEASLQNTMSTLILPSQINGTTAVICLKSTIIITALILITRSNLTSWDSNYWHRFITIQTRA